MSSITGSSAIYQFFPESSPNEVPQGSSDVLFTFLHASDLRLDQVPDFGSDMSNDLTRKILDSPYESVRRLFTYAIDHSTDFILLAGNVLQAQYTGPRGRLFLSEQFELLNRNKIDVYWSASPSDPSEGWFQDSNFPANVHRFPDSAPMEIVVRKNLKPVARLLGLSAFTNENPSDGQPPEPDANFDPQRFLPTASDLYSIVCLGETVEDKAAARIPVDYIALGGRRNHEVVMQKPRTVVYPGMIQGRWISECGSFGAVSVTVKPNRTANPVYIPCAAILRTVVEHCIDRPQTNDELLNALVQKITSTADRLNQKPLLIHLNLSFSESINPKEISNLVSRLVRPENRDQIVVKIRQRMSNRQPIVWLVELNVQWDTMPNAPQEKYSDILSEVSQQSQRWRKKKAGTPDLRSFLTDQQAQGDLAVVADIAKADRDAILKEAELLAADYLQPPPEPKPKP